MKNELILKNGKTLMGDEIFMHGDLTSIVRTKYINREINIKNFFVREKVYDVKLVFSSNVEQINFIDVKESELNILLSTFGNSEFDDDDVENEATELPVPANEEEKEPVLNTPLSEVMYN